jgi:hypothetical protein
MGRGGEKAGEEYGEMRRGGEGEMRRGGDGEMKRGGEGRCGDGTVNCQLFLLPSGAAE